MHRHPISQHMTRTPLTIGKDQPLTRAHEIMREHQIRHLPVLDGGLIVGMVTDRDLHLLESLRDVRPEEVPVEDAMTPDPYTVSPNTSLANVTDHMAKHKFGAAVLADEGRVVGVFTAVDGLRLLSLLLRKGAVAAGALGKKPAKKTPKKASRKPVRKTGKPAARKAKPARRR